MFVVPHFVIKEAICCRHQRVEVQDGQTQPAINLFDEHFTGDVAE